MFTLSVSNLVIPVKLNEIMRSYIKYFKYYTCSIVIFFCLLFSSQHRLVLFKAMRTLRGVPVTATSQMMGATSSISPELRSSRGREDPRLQFRLTAKCRTNLALMKVCLYEPLNQDWTVNSILLL